MVSTIFRLPEVFSQPNRNFALHAFFQTSQSNHRPQTTSHKWIIFPIDIENKNTILWSFQDTVRRHQIFIFIHATNGQGEFHHFCGHISRAQESINAAKSWPIRKGIQLWDLLWFKWKFELNRMFCIHAGLCLCKNGGQW